MADHQPRPILVTGSHRSGSTWTGNMLSAPAHVAYINEPFNINYKPGSFRPHFKHWYAYVCEKNEDEHLEYIQDCLEYKPRQLPKFLRHGKAGDLPRVLRFQAQCAKARWDRKRPLIKDPLAVFSSEWLHNRFDMDVVMLIRHPAAFVGSLKKARWSHPFSHFLEQPLLMDAYLEPFAEDIRLFAEKDQEIIDQAILLWKLVYHTVVLFHEQYSSRWIFLKHEDLSKDPLGEFRALYRTLGIPFDAQAEHRIREFSLVEDSLSGMRRDSRSNIWSWKERLTGAEIEKVREHTYGLAANFYSDEEW